MRGVCAWCGKELRAERPTDASVTTHGICQECFLDLRVKETLKRLQEGPGPYTLFIPASREDLIQRIRREAPPGCSFAVQFDQRRGQRRSQRVAVPEDRRSGRDRRSGNLSFLPSSLFKHKHGSSKPRPRGSRA